MFWGRKRRESMISGRRFDSKSSCETFVCFFLQLFSDFGEVTALWSKWITRLSSSDFFEYPIWKSIAFGTSELRGKSIFFESDKSSVPVGSFSCKWCAPLVQKKTLYVCIYSKRVRSRGAHHLKETFDRFIKFWFPAKFWGPKRNRFSDGIAKKLLEHNSRNPPQSPCYSHSKCSNKLRKLV